MDKERIARIIYNDVRLVEDPSAKGALEKCVRRAYTFGSLHRNMKKQLFDDEVAMTVDAILYDIHADRRYQSLRSAEVEIACLEGFRGTFGNDSTYLTPITFFRWIEAYVVHETRRSAMDWVSREKERQRQSKQAGNEGSEVVFA